MPSGSLKKKKNSGVSMSERLSKEQKKRSANKTTEAGAI